MTRRRRRAGFTLLEAAIALLVLGLAAAGTFAALGAGRRAETGAAQVGPAVALAEEPLAALVLASARELRALPDSLRRGRFASPYDAYAWTAEARPVAGETDLYDLAVTVTWPAGGRLALRTRRFRAAPVGPLAEAP
jgi:prepilin-type N-terminal cleavage/methylation domain-containing protein